MHRCHSIHTLRYLVMQISRDSRNILGDIWNVSYIELQILKSSYEHTLSNLTLTLTLLVTEHSLYVLQSYGAIYQLTLNLHHR